MIDIIVEKAKGFLMNPVETFQQSRNDEPVTVFSYFVALLVVNAILSAIVAAAVVGMIAKFAGLNLGAPFPIVVFFAVLVAGFIFTLIFAAWTHLWVYLFGGRKGIMETVKAITYSHTPRLLFGWIPVLGFIFVLWSLILTIIGIRELQELSTMKAILITGIAILIPLIIVLLILAYFIISPANMVFVPAGQMASPLR